MATVLSTMVLLVAASVTRMLTMRAWPPGAHDDGPGVACACDSARMPPTNRSDGALACGSSATTGKRICQRCRGPSIGLFACDGFCNRNICVHCGDTVGDGDFICYDENYWNTVKYNSGTTGPLKVMPADLRSCVSRTAEDEDESSGWTARSRTSVAETAAAAVGSGGLPRQKAEGDGGKGGGRAKGNKGGKLQRPAGPADP